MTPLPYSVKKSCSKTVGLLLIPCGLLTLSWSGAARADRAIVVGINSYQLLRGSDLEGPLNDVSNLSALLAKRGFVVSKLTDSTATKRGVLKTLNNLSKNVWPSERVVFYFAGHGTRHADGMGALVVSDSNQNESSDLNADELGDALKAVRAKCKSVTVLLDSCFSGAMSRSLNPTGHGTRRARFLRRSPLPTAHTRNIGQTDASPILPEPINDSDNTNMWDSGGKSGICYFTAASSKQVAEENEVSGQPRGLFSYFLGTELSHSSPPNPSSSQGATHQDATHHAPSLTWDQLQMAVAAHVMESTQGMQQPTISQDFRSTPIFESKAPTPSPVLSLPHSPSPASPSPAITIPTTPATDLQKVSFWQVYGSNHSGGNCVQIAMTPNHAPVKIGEKFRFDTTVGVDGYLVILESGASGQLKLLFPTSRKIEDAKVSAGQVVSIPPDKGKAFTPNQVGTEGVKAILFRQDAPASALLNSFVMPQSEAGRPAGLPMLDLKTQGRDLVEVELDDWYTSDLTLQVVN